MPSFILGSLLALLISPSLISADKGGWSKGKQVGVIVGIVAGACFILFIWGLAMGRKYWNGYVDRPFDTQPTLPF